MSHCCFSFDLRFLIIPLLSFRHCVVCFLYYYSSKKKKSAGKLMSLPVMMSLPVTWMTSLPVMWHVTSGHLTDVTSVHVTSFPVTSLPVAHLSQIMMACRSSKQSKYWSNPITCGCRNTHRVMMKNPIIFWKPIIRFLFWEPQYCNVFYVI